MTEQQAAQLIGQQKELLAVYEVIVPFVVQAVRELFPFGAVLSALGLGITLGVAST